MLTGPQSEILGIMFGDGSISRTERSFQIAITGNKQDDKDYLLQHVQPLFAALFGKTLRARYRKHENCMDLYGYSKGIAGTLHSWGMPIGHKKLADLRPKLGVDASSFVRGLFDTDGCVYRKYGSYAQIQFKSVSHELMDYTQKKLSHIGLNPTPVRPDETKSRFFLCRQEEVDTFFELVSPRNPKHLKRIREIRRPPGANSLTHYTRVFACD